MNDIDFLPAEYRRQNLRRQSQPWRIVVIMAFVALLAGAGYSQRLRSGRVEAELQAIEPQYEQAIEYQERFSELQARLQPVRASAELIAYLRHPWPRTQLLAAVTGPLPEEITLDQLSIRRAAQAKAAVKRETEDEIDTESLPPAARDLDSLRKQYDGSRTVIAIQGRARTSTPVHAYLSQLAQHPLIVKAELESMENVDRGEINTFEFQATLLVRPGYGQPGGPKGPTASNDFADPTPSDSLRPSNVPTREDDR